MARRYIAVAVILLFVPVASGLKFNVEVSGLSDHAVYGTTVDTDPLNASASVENIGSIGCSYRLKADLRYGNSTDTAYSRAAGLWPGESKVVSTKYMVLNYTGEVRGNLSLEYCDEEYMLENFSYSVDNPAPDKEFESRTVSSNSTAAEVSVKGVDSATLVPVSKPGAWKVGHAEVEQGKAVLDYEAPLFQPEQRITYAVVKEGEPVGKLSVGLEPSPSLWAEISSNLWKLLFGLSVLLNAVLLLSRRIDVKKPLN